MKLKKEKFILSNNRYDAWVFSDYNENLYIGLFNLSTQTFENFNPLGYYKEDGIIPDFVLESAKTQVTRIFSESF